jgi:hypothetical protein
MANNIISSTNNLFYCLRLLHHILISSRTQCDVFTCTVRGAEDKGSKKVVLRGDNIISRLKMYVHLTERYMYA